MKQALKGFGIVALVCSLFSLIGFHTGYASPSQQGTNGNQIRTVKHDMTGMYTFIGIDTTTGAALPKATNRLPNTSTALSDLAAYGPEFGIKDPARELQFIKSATTRSGSTSYRYQQVYQGVPVIAGELIANYDATGRLAAVVGEVSPNLSLSTSSQITPAAAAQTAKDYVTKQIGALPDELSTSEPQLWIYDPGLLTTSDLPPQLVWRIEVVSSRLLALDYLILVSASTGGISLSFNQADLALARQSANETQTDVSDSASVPPAPLPNFPNPSGATWNSNLTSDTQGAGSSTLICNTPPSALTGAGSCDGTASVTHTNAAHYFAYNTINYYDSHFNRYSVDNAGLSLISNVNYRVNPSIPFYGLGWDRTNYQMLYGDSGFVTTDDLIARGFSYGVSQFESDLFAYYESGAIREMFSNAFGEFVDQWNGIDSFGVPDNPAENWLIGEDSSGGPFISLADPPFYYQPDRTQSDLYDDDSGDMYTNSGVGHKAVYLMAAGGAFNGYTVTSLGNDKTAAILYEANTNLLTSGADYETLAAVLVQACNNIRIGPNPLGITAANCEDVSDAVHATEMHLDPVSGLNFTPQASLCPNPGDSPITYLFNDDIEGGTGNFTFDTLVNPSTMPAEYAWWESSALDGLGHYATSGTQSLFGIDNPELFGYEAFGYQSFIEMTNAVTLSAGNRYFLHFNHSMVFETGGNYDGGVVEYSVDGGNWTDIGPFFEAGQDYNGVLSSGDNPLGGRNSFTQESHGYVSTRYNLSSLAGHSVRFRWLIGSDASVFNLGWFLDDIKIYSCTAFTAPEIEVEGPGSVPIAVNDPYDMGTTPVGVPLSQTITIRNSGAGNLSLLAAQPTVTGDFSAGNFGTTTIAPGGATTFTLTCNATTSGDPITGTVVFANNDLNENPFEFAVTCSTPTPEIEVEGQGGTSEPIWDDGDYNLGMTTLGVPISKTITVRNTGGANLDLLTNPPTISNPAITATSFGSTSLLPGGSTSFTLTCTPTTPGYTSGIVSFDNNDSDEDPFNFTAFCETPAPEIIVWVTLTSTITVLDGGTVNLGSTIQGTPLTRTFTIQNSSYSTGDLSLLTNPPAVTGDYMASSMGATTLAPGSSTTFTLTCNASTPSSPVIGTVSFANNDPDENPFNFTVYCTVIPLAPEIQVQGHLLDIIADGGGYLMGTTTVGKPFSRTFTIRNLGTSNLHLSSSSPSTTGEFTASSFGATTLAPDASTTFTVTCNATNAADPANGTVSFNSDDADEDPFDFWVSCTVVNLCPSLGDMPADYLISDDFDNGQSNFVAGIPVNPYQITPEQAWYIRTNGYSSSGTQYLFGINHPAQLGYPEGYKYESYAAMANNVSLPASSAYYLYFNHYFSFGSSDGGILEYSINNGNWTDAGALFEGGQNYNGVTGSYNPRPDRSAFINSSGTYVFSRYDLSSLAGNNIRFRWVIGADMYGRSRGWSLDDVQIYRCVVPPTAPTALFASGVSQTQIDLTWTDNATDETAFHIERSANGSDGWVEIGTVTANQITSSDSELTCGTSYYYRVRAYRSGDGAYSGYSNTANANTSPCPPPAAPTALSANGVSPMQIDLAWTDNSADETAFRVERSPNGTSGWTEIASTAANATGYQNTGLTCNATYFYRVRAYRSGDGQYSTYSDAASAMTQACPPPPTAPSGLMATAASQTQINLGWADNSSDETNFRIERSPDGSTGWAEIAWAAVDATSYQNTGLTCNTLYYYRVRAYRSSDGQFSAYSNTASATTQACLPPTAPSGLTATAASQTQINLGWTDNASDETNFRIERSPDGSTSWTEIGTAAANATSYQNIGLVCNTTYYYRVRAFRDGDGQFSNYSNVANTTTQACPPPAVPSGLTATAASPTQINLGWTDNASDETNFRIERSPDGSTSWSEIGTAAANTTSYPNTGLTCGTTYYYRVRAYRSDDNQYSIYSNVANATTQACSPPAIPSGLTAIAVSQTQIDLGWMDNSSDETNFRIERSPDGSTGWTEIDTAAANATSYQNMGLTCNTTYYYRVRAYRGGDGQYSAYSNTASATTQACPPPAAPSDLTATGVAEDRIDLAWTDNSTDETAFRVEHSPNGTSGWTEIALTAADATSYENTGLACNTTYYYRVRAYRGSDGLFSSYSNSANATTQACSTVPSLIAPPDGSLTNNNRPTFVWSPTLTGDSYQIEIDDNANFSSPEQETTQAGLSYTATTLADATTYYWHVRAYTSGVPGPWSVTWSVSIDVARLSAPLLRSPKDGINTPDKTPKLTWKSVKGAVAYHVQLASQPDFDGAGLLVNLDTLTATSYTLPDTNPLLYGTYYWRARARDAAGRWSDWSIVRSFTVTLLKAPKNGDFTTDTTPAFTWSKATGATQYQYQLATDAGFTALVVDQPLTGTRFIPVTPLAYGRYYWRVSAQVGGVWSEWTPAWVVTVTPTPPSKPVLVAPANKSSLSDETPDFAWNAVIDAVTYQIQIDNQSNFASPVQDALVPDTVYSAQALPDSGTYYWRVRALNSVGTAGQWSSTWSFSLNGPGVPVLTAPASNTRLADPTPDLVWGGVSGFTDYQVQVSADKTFGLLAESALVSATTHTTLPLADGLYYWRVRTINTSGVGGAWTAPWRFTVDTTGPAAPVLKAPRAASGTPDTTPTFKWSKPKDGVAYQLQVFSDPALSVVVLDTPVGGTSYTPLVSLPFGRYYWRVMAQDALGNLGDWSLPSTFTLTILKAPKDASTTTDTTPAFKWVSVVGTAGYQLQVADEELFTAPVIDTPVAGTTYTPVAPLAYGLSYWRVSADGGVTWMPAWSFTVTPGLPGNPKLAAPRNKTLTNDATPTLGWGAASDGNTYQIQIDDDKKFNTPDQDTTVGELTYTAAELGEGTWYWRVRALNTENAPGKWSTTWSLTVDITPPTVPIPIAPTGDARVTNPKLTLSWNASPGAVRYEVQLDPDLDFSLPPIDAGKKTTYKPPTSLAQATYYWRVRAIDKAGNVSLWSDGWVFHLVAGNTIVTTPDGEPVLVPAEEPVVEPPPSTLGDVPATPEPPVIVPLPPDEPTDPAAPPD